MAEPAKDPPGRNSPWTARLHSRAHGLVITRAAGWQAAALSRYASASLQYWKHFRTSATGSAPRYSNSMSAGISYFLLLRR